MLKRVSRVRVVESRIAIRIDTSITVVATAFLGRRVLAKKGRDNSWSHTKGARNINFVERFPGSPTSLLIFIAQGFIGFARVYFSVPHFSVSSSEFTEKLTERYRTER